MPCCTPYTRRRIVSYSNQCSEWGLMIYLALFFLHRCYTVKCRIVALSIEKKTQHRLKCVLCSSNRQETQDKIGEAEQLVIAALMLVKERFWGAAKVRRCQSVLPSPRHDNEASPPTIVLSLYSRRPAVCSTPVFDLGAANDAVSAFTIDAAT